MNISPGKGRGKSNTQVLGRFFALVFAAWCGSTAWLSGRRTKNPGSLDFQGFRGLSRWQREKDSNPHKQSQSLSCYPYTIPLFVFRFGPWPRAHNLL